MRYVSSCQIHHAYANLDIMEYYKTNELFSVHPDMSCNNVDDVCMNFVKTEKKLNLITET